MADIFRTKEVYKKVRIKESSGSLGNPIIPVRGLYVVGDWRAPEYHNPCIMITDIQTSPLKIRDFTEATSNPMSKDSNIGIIKFSVRQQPLTVTRYTQNKIDIKPNDSNIGMIKFSANKNINVLKYSQKDEKISGKDSNIGMIKFSVRQQPLNVVRYHKQYFESQPDSYVKIISVITTPAEISDVTL